MTVQRARRRSSDAFAPVYGRSAVFATASAPLDRNSVHTGPGYPTVALMAKLANFDRERLGRATERNRVCDVPQEW